MAYTSDSQEVAWNLSQAIIEQIAIILNAATNNYIRYNFETCFRNLKAIRMIIVANLKQDEREKFVEKEKELNNTFGLQVTTYSGFNLSKKVEFSKNYGSELIKNLDSYSELLMDTLKKYGYLIPPKEDKKNLNK
ncbi:MAG: hypothetical protein ABSG05_03425 [Candidatus Pacearchaeota archaeon]|jgi:hypothetical protein